MKSDHYIASSDSDQTLHYIIWEPETQPKGVVQLVHGMEEYIARYDTFAQILTKEGWAVIGHDHLGHGTSGNWERGFFTEKENGAQILIDDMHLMTLKARSLWQNIPVFIFGHSMGSFFSRKYLVDYGKDIDGLIICGSGWYPPIATGAGYWAAKIIGKIKGCHSKDSFLTALCSLPFLFAFRKEGKGAWLSKNKENVKTYNEDSLCGFGFTCGGYRDMYRNLLLVSLHHNYHKLTPTPILIISGADDPVGGKNSVKKIAAEYRKYGFQDVTEKTIEGNRHEILFEENAVETMGYLVQWMNKQYEKQTINF